MKTIIQSLKSVEDNIYKIDYDELSDYLKGVRDVINMLNGEECAESVAEFILNSIFT